MNSKNDKNIKEKAEALTSGSFFLGKDVPEKIYGDHNAITHPWLSKKFDPKFGRTWHTNTQMQKAIQLMIKRDFTDLSYHTYIVAGTLKEKKKHTSLFGVKYVKFDPETDTFIFLSITCSTHKLKTFYDISKPHWYDAFSEHTIAQSLKTIKEIKVKDPSRKFVEYFLKVGKNNKYKYASIFFQPISAFGINFAMNNYATIEGLKRAISQRIKENDESSSHHEDEEEGNDDELDPALEPKTAK